MLFQQSGQILHCTVLKKAECQVMWGVRFLQAATDFQVRSRSLTTLTTIQYWELYNCSVVPVCMYNCPEPTIHWFPILPTGALLLAKRPWI